MVSTYPDPKLINNSYEIWEQGCEYNPYSELAKYIFNKLN